VAGLALVLALSTASAANASCPSIARAPMSDRGSTLSGQWLYDARMREARRARTWRYAWTGINGAIAVGSFALLPLVPSEQRLELVIGGVGSTATALLTWFVPLEVEATLDRKVKATSLCDGLRIEEELTAAAAEDEAVRVSWPFHLINLGAGALYTVIVGVGTPLLVGKDRWASGVVDGVVAFALGEAQLFTQPTRLAGRYEAYGRRDRAPRALGWVQPVAGGGAVFTLGSSF